MAALDLRAAETFRPAAPGSRIFASLVRDDKDGRSAVPYSVYMLASQRNGTLYIGVTNDLGRRVYEHRNKRHIGFTATYGVTRLVWYEHYDQIDDAISREKKLKKWRRAWKLVLIEDMNPTWRDLYEELNQ